MPMKCVVVSYSKTLNIYAMVKKKFLWAVHVYYFQIFHVRIPLDFAVSAWLSDSLLVYKKLLTLTITFER